MQKILYSESRKRYKQNCILHGFTGSIEVFYDLSSYKILSIFWIITLVFDNFIPT